MGCSVLLSSRKSGVGKAARRGCGRGEEGSLLFKKSKPSVAGEKHSKQPADICHMHGVCSDKGKQKEMNVRTSPKEVHMRVKHPLFRKVLVPVSLRYGKGMSG